ncbi:MAG TPA: hypothetical protein PLO62_11635 [Candidatus Hydrogenedentes bacterium]|nr:hypothetical protein [Candidatus Hydrogenedentota bacterium]HOS02222.1 hypothetical protein [Candidatus Hydrogenedentota bacterium]
MADSIEQAAAALRDRKEPWVKRRDAADFLSNVATRAIAALKANAAEKDVDVHDAVTKALGQASAALAGIAPVHAKEPQGAPDPQSLALACAKEGTRTVTPIDGGFRIDVALPNGRKQAVNVYFQTRKDGVETVRVESRCAPVDEKAFAWALRANKDLFYCAVCIDEDDAEKPRLALRGNFVRGELTPATLKAAVKETAFYADWIEAKLTRSDGY